VNHDVQMLFRTAEKKQNDFKLCTQQSRLEKQYTLDQQKHVLPQASKQKG